MCSSKRQMSFQKHFSTWFKVGWGVSDGGADHLFVGQNQFSRGMISLQATCWDPGPLCHVGPLI